MNEQMTSQSNALKWLMEIEASSDPNFLNALLLNIFRVSKRIKDVQVVMDPQKKKILIWLELDWLGRKFFQRKTLEAVGALIIDALPTYSYRVILDKTILDKAVELTQRLK